MAWHLAGLDVVGGGRPRVCLRCRPRVAAARQRAEAVARRYGVPVVDSATLGRLAAPGRSPDLLYLDVRDPAEYRAGHLPGSLMAPGGQLVQETDSWLGVWGARVVLVDDTGVRARMTASWLRRMGWDAAVLEGGLGDGPEGRRRARTRHADGEERHLPARLPEPATVQSSELQANPGVVADLALSRQHRQGHIPGLVRDPRPSRRGARETPGAR